VITQLPSPRRNPRRLISVFAALALTGALSATALAIPPYAVYIRVPRTVVKSKQFVITAFGHSANLSKLTVFIDNQACAKTPAGEALRPSAVKIISHGVVGQYTRSRGILARALGRRAVCAYLTSVPPPSPPLLRARATAVYTVVS
jgi:hypothetical protein